MTFVILAVCTVFARMSTATFMFAHLYLLPLSAEP